MRHVHLASADCPARRNGSGLTCRNPSSKAASSVRFRSSCLGFAEGGQAIRNSHEEQSYRESDPQARARRGPNQGALDSPGSQSEARTLTLFCPRAVEVEGRNGTARIAGNANSESPVQFRRGGTGYSADSMRYHALQLDRDFLYSQGNFQQLKSSRERGRSGICRHERSKVRHPFDTGPARGQLHLHSSRRIICRSDVAVALAACHHC